MSLEGVELRHDAGVDAQPKIEDLGIVRNLLVHGGADVADALARAPIGHRLLHDEGEQDAERDGQQFEQEPARFLLARRQRLGRRRRLGFRARSTRHWFCGP
jgi:hypothetical protein